MGRNGFLLGKSEGHSEEKSNPKPEGKSSLPKPDRGKKAAKRACVSQPQPECPEREEDQTIAIFFCDLPLARE